MTLPYQDLSGLVVTDRASVRVGIRVRTIAVGNGVGVRASAVGLQNSLSYLNSSIAAKICVDV